MRYNLTDWGLYETMDPWTIVRTPISIEFNTNILRYISFIADGDFEIDEQSTGKPEYETTGLRCCLDPNEDNGSSLSILFLLHSDNGATIYMIASIKFDDGSRRTVDR